MTSTFAVSVGDVFQVATRSLVACVALTVLVLLPGFALTRVIEHDTVEGFLGVALALGWGIVGVAVVALTLVAFGVFSASVLAIVLVFVALLGAGPALVWLGALRRPVWPAAVVGAAALPLVATTGGDGYRPAETFQFYYWDLGRQLDTAGGIPAWVPEYGVDVRWLPDYLVFNVVSEGYRWLTGPIDEAAAVVGWRAPLALVSVALLYQVFRLWCGRGVAIFGVLLTSGSTWYLTKFNAYKPESLGIVIGLLSVWLGVTALRRGMPRHLVLVGILVGANVAVHAIAAAVLAMLLLAACAVELVEIPRGERARGAGALALAAFLSFGVVAGVGWSLQGRSSPASDATRPQLSTGEDDPTFTYLRRSTGRFDDVDPPSVASRIETAVDEPWRGFDVFTGTGLVLAGVVAVGVGVGVLRDRRLRAGTAVAAIWVLLVAAAIVYFALFFETFVPQRTGSARFGQYSPLIVAFIVTLGIGGFATIRVPRRAQVPVVTACAVLLVALLARPVARQIEAQGEVSTAAQRSLAELRMRADPEATTLSNVLTHGTVSFFGGVEVPLEGRQPLIEEPSLLDRANAYLLDAQQFFTQAPTRDFLADYDVEWLVVAVEPAPFGVRTWLGGSPEEVARGTGLEPVWAEDGIALFRVDDEPSERSPLGPARSVGWRWLVVLVVTAGASVVVRRISTRWEQREPAPDPPVATSASR